MLTLERILVGTPLAALLILFDLVIDSPTHPATAANLALLDVGCGRFSGLEYASQGTLPGSIASEFTQIARAYVREKSELPTIISTTLPDMPTSSGGAPESHNSIGSSALLPNMELQPTPLGWNPQSDNEIVYATDMLNLFGSYFPLWGDHGAIEM